jgi:hypothetical protein
MSRNELLIWYAYRYSTEMGQAVEAVIIAEGEPTQRQVEKLYKLLKRDSGRHLSPDVYVALLDVIRGSHAGSGCKK